MNVHTKWNCLIPILSTSPILPVSGMKLLVISGYYIQVIKLIATVPRLFGVLPRDQLSWNQLTKINFPRNQLPLNQLLTKSTKITHSKMKTNIRLWMYSSNGTVWCPFCLLWSNIASFRDEIVSNQWLLRTSESQPYPDYFEITHSKMKTCKHQIMNVHIKWNCLIPIFVYFGAILPVSGMKLLVISCYYTYKR